jgi:putative Mg2+ transporter-C (MgtC) family protein
MVPHLRDDLWMTLPLLVAVALGGAIGWEREAKGKVAGLRTHMLVALSSAAFVVLGEIAPKVAEQVTSDLRMDPVRIIQAVVIGIGFVGSGVVQTTKEHERADGLTTAVSIWCTAAMGIAAGFRHNPLAVAVAAITLLVMRVLRALEPNDRGH